jgi:hypothetical protein
VDQQIQPSVADMHEKTLSFEELKQWLQASVGQSFSIHIAIPRGIVAFLDGADDRVIVPTSDRENSPPLTSVSR